MDNRIISVQSKGREAFDLAFQLLFDNASGGKASHYIEVPDKGLLLLWSEDHFNVNGVKTSAIKLPFPMRWKEAADMAWGWLINQPEEKYDQYLDHDGSNGKGFLVYNESWGHVAGSHYGILGLKPIWAWYGK